MASSSTIGIPTTDEEGVWAAIESLSVRIDDVLLKELPPLKKDMSKVDVILLKSYSTPAEKEYLKGLEKSGKFDGEGEATAIEPASSPGHRFDQNRCHQPRRCRQCRHCGQDRCRRF
jgi:hypothetical protein